MATSGSVSDESTGGASYTSITEDRVSTGRGGILVTPAGNSGTVTAHGLAVRPSANASFFMRAYSPNTATWSLLLNLYWDGANYTRDDTGLQGIALECTTQPTIASSSINFRFGFSAPGYPFTFWGDGRIDMIGRVSCAGVTSSARIQETVGAGSVAGNTLTLPNANEASVSGTPTINGIVTTGLQTGIKVDLTLAAGAVLVHASGAPGGSALALKLAGAVNWTVGAGGGAITLRLTSTGWEERARVQFA